MFEAQKLESLRSSLSIAQPCDGREPPEENAPSLFLGQFQPKLCKPFPHLRLEAVHVLSVLESRHEVISETHQIRLTSTGWFDFLLEPQVEQKVKVDVTQHGRDHAPNAKANFQFERLIRGWRDGPVLDLRLKK
jgi:hypothetical protein